MKLRLGSRGSKLAMTQAQGVADQIRNKAPRLEIQILPITTTGDKNTRAPLQSLGGKGMFVKELEEALLRKEIDLAVHSLKDVPERLPPGLELGPFPLREDPRDALISRFGEQLNELPRNSIVGTGSPRRKAQIRHRFKQRAYRLEPIRGNLDTRLKKLQEGHYDAIIVAVAGLKRLGLESEITQILEFDVLLPAAGQGCLGLELREGDASVRAVLESIKDENSDRTARAERAFLSGLGGDCFTAVAAAATLQKDIIRMEALLLDTAGEKAVHAKEEGPADQPEYIGARLAGRILYEGGSEILSAALTEKS